jgi:hypothetical protein
MVPPHPSPAGPHVMPGGQVVLAVHGGTPQTLGVPEPPQVAGGVHEVQSSVPPQPSPMTPHVAPPSIVGHVVIGKHATPHSNAVPPPPHVAGAVHEPQL